MKIAFVGNIANNFYREVKALKQSSLIDADLYFVHIPDNNTVLPESDEPNLKNNYPEWILMYRGFQASKFSILGYMLGFKRFLSNNNQEIIDRLNDYDLCVLSGPDAALIPFLNTTTIFRATGSDLTVFPIFSYEDYIDMYQAQRSSSLLEKWKSWAIWFFKRNLFRNAIQAATYVDAGFGKPFDDAAKRLEIVVEKRINLFMLGIDRNVFRKKTDSENIHLKWSLSSADYYVFMPPRIMIKSTPALKQSGQWKASDVAIEGFGKFLDNLDVKDRSRVKLLIPERSLPTDLPIAKAIVEKLNLAKNVIYIEGREKQGLARDEMIEIYSISSVVMDDFGAGWYGSVAVEALSCGVPLVTYVPDQLLKDMFPWHPIQIAQTAEEIGSALHKLYRDVPYAQRIGEDSIRWVQEYHSLDATRKRLESGLLSLAANKT